MSALRAYSGVATVCTKCRGVGADTTYQAGVPRVINGGGEAYTVDVPGDTRDSLLRRCHNCGYAWLEACVDTQVAVLRGE